MAAMSSPAWTALEAARLQRVERVPFAVGPAVVGSVARAHLDALAAWPRWLALSAGSVALTARTEERDDVLAEVNAALRAQGLVVAWRDETFPLFDPATLAPLARFERASARFWGTLTLGAHANGWVADDGGRVQSLWIAQRSFTKATDPGLFDNLVGGGVPAGQSPRDALMREGWEEAGLVPREMANARPAGVLRLARDIPEGFQHEWLYAFDLQLPAGRVPQNQDGEVHAFDRLPAAEALALAAGERMTVDAALVTISFGLRHGLVDDASVAARLQALHVTPP